MKTRYALRACLLFMTTTACEGGGLPLPGPETKEVKIFFAAPSVQVGNTVRADVVGFFSRGVRLNSDGLPQEYSFTTADTAIAALELAKGSPAVSFAFNVRGKQPGWVRVTAMINGVIGVDSMLVVPRG
jgi:hypothetical protein